MFCFTGGMLSLKRTAGQREVRARGGQTQTEVNERLDYLVVGAKGSPHWKHGGYGRKIEKAMELRALARRPHILNETQFMDALATCAEVNVGEIDAKVIVVTYRFLRSSREYVQFADFHQALNRLRREGAHVSAQGHYVGAFRELYDDAILGEVTDIVVEVRVVRQVPLEASSRAWVDEIERVFEEVEGIDGESRWFEREEGSAAYVRLMQEIPQELQLPGY
ncbi:MAG: BRCT domain-containing protein [Gemmatimonadota bacterium]